MGRNLLNAKFKYNFGIPQPSICVIIICSHFWIYGYINKPTCESLYQFNFPIIINYQRMADIILFKNLLNLIRSSD